MKTLVIMVCAVLSGLIAEAAIRVTDFGAKGDGVTDDTAAIRCAVKALETNRPKARYCVRRHKVVFSDAPFDALVFPEGTYRISEPIVVTGDAMLLGEGKARIVNAAADREGFYFRETHNLIVKGLEFDGGVCQVRLWTRNRDCSYLHVADCTFRNCRGTSLVSVSFKESPENPSVPIETAYGEERGIPYNNSTLMLVERCRFEDNATALQLYSDGLTVRDCDFRAPGQATAPQLNVGCNGHMGVEMYFRNLSIAYPGGAAKTTAAIRFNGGRGIFEDVRISSVGDLTAIRSLARFNTYHKPYCLDLRDVSLDTGAAPVISFAGDDFPNRVSVYGLASTASVRKRLFAFEREPTRESIDKAHQDPDRQMSRSPEQVLAFQVKGVDERRFDCTVPAALRPYVRPVVPDAWKRPLDHASGSTFAQDLPTGPVFADAPLETLIEKARQAGGGTIVLPGVWQEVTRTIDVPDNTRIACRGRAALWMKDEDAPLFRVADGVSCVFENLMLIDGLHAVEVNGAKGRVRLLDCTLLGQKAASIAAQDARAGERCVEVSGGQAYCPYLYRGNATFAVDGYWYEESTEREKGENRPSYSAIVNEKGGRMFLRDFLGVPCYFQHTKKEEAYKNEHPERRGEFRWIDNFGTFASVNMRYGGEWGGLTPVYHFGEAVTWIEGGNIELGNFYMKSDRAVVVADSPRPDVTIVGAASGHHIEPFQVFCKQADGTYSVADARLCGNYPFQDRLPVWPKGRVGDAEAEYDFSAEFTWDGKRPIRLDLEASCVADVFLNGVFVGSGPRPAPAGQSRQARFPLKPRIGRNRILIRTRKGAPGYICAQVTDNIHRLARTAPDGDFTCGLPLEERPKPPVVGWDAVKRPANPNADRATALLLRWCDAIERYQVKAPDDPRVKGAVLCPACALQHGRVCDVVYPMTYLWTRTGDSKYLTCAIHAVAWSRFNLSDMGGARQHNDFQGQWWGITVFSQCAVGKTLLAFGDRLPADVRADWRRWFDLQTEFVFKALDLDGHFNVNYTAAYCEAMALAWKLTGDEKYRTKARETADKLTVYFLPDGMLAGEKHPPTFVSPRGFRAVDLGYNAEESLPSLYHCAALLGDEEYAKKLEAMGRGILEFVLPDGGIDNSMGSRLCKWTYYGSRTSDGALPLFAALAKRGVPGAARAVVRHLDILERCTSRESGLLTGGLYYDEADEGACTHHAFAHAKSLVDFLLGGATEFKDNSKLPRELPYGIREFASFGTTLASTADWCASFSLNDVHHNAAGTACGGGSLTLLWSRLLGRPVLAGTMLKYSTIERENMQEQRRDRKTLCMMPRIESGNLTNVADVQAEGRARVDGPRVIYQAKGCLSAADGKRSDRPYALDYAMGGNKVTVVATASGSWDYVLPVVAGPNDKVTVVDPRHIAICLSERGRIDVTASSPIRIEQTMRGDRAFTPVAGIMATYLRMTAPKNGSVSVEISVIRTPDLTQTP